MADNAQKRKRPQRMCIACRQMKDKNMLVRVICVDGNKAVVDESGKASGRGAYVCRNIDCIEKAIKSRGFERALEISHDDTLRDRLIKTVEEKM